MPPILLMIIATRLTLQCWQRMWLNAMVPPGTVVEAAKRKMGDV